MFDIQLFGENDTMTSTSTVTIAYSRASSDTSIKGTFQKYKLPNPKQNLSSSTVQNVMSSAVTNTILINNKTGATADSIAEGLNVQNGQAYYDNVGTLELDIS